MARWKMLWQKSIKKKRTTILWCHYEVRSIMVAMTTSRLRRVLGGVLVVGMTLCWGDQAQARRRHRHHHHRYHLHFGFHHHWPHYYYWPHYYWPPYYYWPPHYWPYAPYDYYGRPYTPSERRRFPAPAFRLPGLFHYPGALAKDEPIGSAPEQPGTTTPQSGQKATKP